MSHKCTSNCIVCCQCCKLLCKGNKIDCIEKDHKIVSYKELISHVKIVAEQKLEKLKKDFNDPLILTIINSMKTPTLHNLEALQRVFPEDSINDETMTYIRNVTSIETKKLSHDLISIRKELQTALDKCFLEWIQTKYIVEMRQSIDDEIHNVAYKDDSDIQQTLTDILKILKKFSTDLEKIKYTYKEYEEKFKKIGEDTELELNRLKEVQKQADLTEQSLIEYKRLVKLLAQRKRTMKEEIKALEQPKEIAKKHAKYTFRLKEIRKEIDEADWKLAQIKGEIDISSVKYIIQNEQLEKVKYELNRINLELKLSQKTLEEEKKECKELNEKIANTINEYEKKEALMKENEAKAQKELKDINDKLNNTKADLPKTEEEFNNLKQKCKELENSTELLRSKEEAIKKSIEDKDLEMQTLLSEIDSYKEKKEMIAKEETMWKENLVKLENSMNELLQKKLKESNECNKLEEAKYISSKKNNLQTKRKKLQEDESSIVIKQYLDDILVTSNVFISSISGDTSNKSIFKKFISEFTKLFLNVKEVMILSGNDWQLSKMKYLLNISKEKTGPEKLRMKNVKLNCKIKKLKEIKGEVDLEFCFISEDTLFAAVQQLSNSSSGIKKIRIIDNLWTLESIKELFKLKEIEKVERVEMGLSRDKIDSKMTEALNELKDLLKTRIDISYI